MDTLSRKMNVLHRPIMYTCRADCHRDHQENNYQTMEHACGDPGEGIVRGDERFKRRVNQPLRFGICAMTA